LSLLKKTAQCNRFYGDDAQKSPDFSRIISDAHVNRLKGMLDDKQAGKIVCGGRVNASTRYIEPTVITDVNLESKVMQEEIFGPLMPIIKIKSIDEGIALVRSNPIYDKPLSLYVFGKNRAVIDQM
jgi:aldehyde dehydrogenase (NAD+)